MSRVSLRVWNCNNDVMWVFSGLRILNKHGIKPNMKDYHIVYEDMYAWDDSKSIFENLEDIFEISNTVGFRHYLGHSMSVSDIVEVNNKYYYVDDFGFKEVSARVFESVIRN